MYVIQLIHANMYTFHALGDQAQFLGLMRLAGGSFATVWLYKARRIRVRYNLDKKVPCKRLSIDGETYGH